MAGRFKGKVEFLTFCGLLTALKSSGEVNVPTAAFVLMAAEAARQIFMTAGFSEGFIVMSDISFDRPLPLSLFGTTPKVELHLHSQPIGIGNQFSFRILYLLPSSKDSSEGLCSGSFRRLDGLIQEKDHAAQQSHLNHDPWLLEQSQALGIDLSPRLLDLQTNSDGSSGMFDSRPIAFDHYYIEPEILHSILQLASLSISQRALPSVQRIQSIEALTLPLMKKKEPLGDALW